MHRPTIALAVLTLVAACSAATAAPPEPTTTTNPVPVSTTAPGTTTTSTRPPPPIILEGVPDDLTALVTDLYLLAAGRKHSPVGGPDRLVPEPGVATGMAGRIGEGSWTELGGTRLAVVTAGPDVFGAVDDGTGWRLVAGVAPSLDVEGFFGEKPMVIAIVGSDARPGEDPAWARADSIHLIGIDPAGAAAIVGIPRDSWVDIPGYGRGKINAALSTGGPDRLMATLESVTGITIDGYVLTGFVGFQEVLGNVLEGIVIDLPAAVRDRWAGADFSAGEQYMNGPQALAFARARKTLAAGDFDRQQNGGLIMLSALFTAKARGPLDLPRMLEQAIGWLTTDLSPEQLLTLGLTAYRLDPLEVDNRVAPGWPATRGSASVVELSPDAGALFADLTDGRLTG